MKGLNQVHHSPDTTVNLESSVFARPEARESVFYHHEQTVQHKTPIPNSAVHEDWIAGILIGCLIVLAWNHVYNSSRLLQALKAPFSKRFINQLIREGNLFNERIAFTFVLVYLVLSALFLYIINDHFTGYKVYGLTGFSLYLIILAGLTGFFGIKSLLIYFTGVIFRTRETTYHYLLNQLLFAILLVPLLLMFSVLLVYIGAGFYFTFSIIFVLAVLVIQFLRGFLIGMALTRFSYLLLFMYLCSLEILPLLVVTKIVVNIAKTAVV